MTPALRSPLAVVCHDAGACNVILPWLQGRDLGLRPVLAGPAVRLWRERFGAVPGGGGGDLDGRLEAALEGAAMLLAGTGWASDLEHRARLRARERGVFSAAVIDHWVDYPERFRRAGAFAWPDEFWVTDEAARAIAERAFPGAVVRVFDNRYLREQAAAVAPLPQLTNAAAAPVLYVLEPMRSDWGRGVAGEFQALEFFAESRTSVGIDAAAPLRLRPHPSDPPGKYDAWIEARRRRGEDVALDPHPTLADAIGAAACVVGCESMALVVALAAGRRVVSTLPPWAPPCRLPHPGIERLAKEARSPVVA